MRADSSWRWGLLQWSVRERVFILRRFVSPCVSAHLPYSPETCPVNTALPNDTWNGYIASTISPPVLSVHLLSHWSVDPRSV